MTLCILEQLEFYHKVKYAKSCPTADLLAILNENSLLSVHKISGKAVWSRPMAEKTGEKVIDIQWSSDGKYLLIRLADTTTLILGREDGRKIYIGSQYLLDWIECKSYSLYLEQDQGNFSLNLIDKTGIVYQAKKLANCSLAILRREFLVIVTLKDTTISRITADSLGNHHRTVPITHFTKQIEILEDCFNQIVDKLLSFGLQNIIEIGVAADEELFRALTELASVIPIRSLESKYHTAYRAAYEFLLDEGITNMSQQAAIGDELKRLLKLHQDNWGRLVLWIKSILEAETLSASIPDRCAVKTWQKACSSTRLFMVLNILGMSKNQWDGKMERLIKIWNDLVKKQDKNLIQLEPFVILADVVREAYLLSNEQMVLKSDDMLISINIFTGAIDRMQCPKDSKILHHHRYFLISNDGKLYLDDQVQPLGMQPPVNSSSLIASASNIIFDVSPERKTLMILDETRTIITIHAF